MGFKYTDRVYKFVTGTTPTEQLVLAVLAHIVNDRNGEGFPSITTIVERSHLGRSTVMRSLDALRDKGLIKWKTGGRTKNGRVLSNLYALTLPKSQKERSKPSDAERWEDVDNSQGWVPERDGYPSQRETPHSPAAGPLPSQSGTPSYIETSIDHPDGHHQPPEASGTTPGRCRRYGIRAATPATDKLLSIFATLQIWTVILLTDPRKPSETSEVLSCLTNI